MSRRGVPVATIHGDVETKIKVMSAQPVDSWELATLWRENGMLHVELYGPGGHEVAATYAIPLNKKETV